LEALKAKNIKQTELVADLREAVLRVARHFQCTDPKICGVVSGRLLMSVWGLFSQPFLVLRPPRPLMLGLSVLPGRSCPPTTAWRATSGTTRTMWHACAATDAGPKPCWTLSDTTMMSWASAKMTSLR
jgi:hypothetical protein